MALIIAGIAIILVVEWQITKTVQRLRVVEKRCGIYDPEKEDDVPPSGRRVLRNSEKDSPEQKQAA